MKFQAAWVVGVVSLVLAISSSAHGGGSKKSRRTRGIPTSSAVRIVYGLPSQNRDSTKIESAKAVLKDRNSNFMVTIELEETGPDSGTFAGIFAMGAGELKKISPQIYIPPQELLQNKKGLELAIKMVQEKKIKSRVFIYRKEEGVHIVDVYDTKEQARAARKAYREQVSDPSPEPKVVKDNPVVDLLGAAQMAKEEAERKEAAKKAAMQELERVRMEQVERQKALERKKEQERLQAAELARRKKEAGELAEKAMGHYLKGEFTEARDLFEKSVELDPSNTTYSYQYGVSLYKTNEFNKSVVVLEMAGDANPNERDFYLGLNFHKLKEKERALKAFQKVRNAQDKVLSPSAAFYEGIILFEEHRYEPAKDSFQFVLDTSEDPKLDERAEEYIEHISRILYYLENKEKQWIFTGTFGTNYDSNVLLFSDAYVQQDSPSDMAGVQLIFQGQVQWRPIYEKQHEWSTNLSYAMTSTTNSSFQVVDTLRTADYSLAGISMPYIFKGTLGEKGYQLKASPFFESTSGDPVAGASPTTILNSFGALVSNTLVMTQFWFSVYDIEIRKDNSLLSVTDPNDDASAMKYTVKSSQMYFFDKKREQGIIGDLGYIMNSATGKNSNYTKLDLGVTYLRPIEWWKLSWLVKVGLYQQSYADKETPRNDSNSSLLTGFSKKFADWVAASLTMGYINNASNTNQYSKYTIGTSVIMTTSL